ncbi:MAG: hypothetical protein LBB49_02040, partial [Gracilibacteraceae bacterium]|nr:hypothetical protein [Gracilibacteraceae bacterium]
GARGPVSVLRCVHVSELWVWEGAVAMDNGQWTMDNSNGQWTRLISFSLWTNGQWEAGIGSVADCVMF